MDANQSENLFVSIRGWKCEPPTGQPRMNANGRESKRELIRVYSRLFVVVKASPRRIRREWTLFYRNRNESIRYVLRVSPAKSCATRADPTRVEEESRLD